MYPFKPLNYSVRSALTAATILILLLPASCLKKPSQTNNGMSDSELRSIKGIQISTTGTETVFKIPIMQLASSKDRQILFNGIIENYTSALGDLKKDFLSNKKTVNAKGLEKLDAIANQNDKVRQLVEKLVDDLVKNKSFSDRMRQKSTEAGLNPGVYNSVERQNMTDTYLIPQVLAIFMGGKATTPDKAGIEGSISIGLVFIVQAYMEVIIDNQTKREKLNSKGLVTRKPSVDGAFYILPAAGIGFGFQDGSPSAGVEFGVGIGLGPIDNPHALNNYVGSEITGELNLGSLVHFNARGFLMGHPEKLPVYFFLASSMVSNKISKASAFTGVRMTGFLDPYTYLQWNMSGARIEDLSDAQKLESLNNKGKALRSNNSSINNQNSSTINTIPQNNTQINRLSPMEMSF